MAETLFGVSMIPMYYTNEVRQIRSELLCFLRHPRVTCTTICTSGLKSVCPGLTAPLKHQTQSKATAAFLLTSRSN